MNKMCAIWLACKSLITNLADVKCHEYMNKNGVGA